MSTRWWPALLLLLAASPEVQPYVGRAERSAALCPAGMVWVPAGDFFAGADGAAVGLSDYVPDIVRDPRPRAQRHTAGACVDRHEFPYDGPAIADVTWV